MIKKAFGLLKEEFIESAKTHGLFVLSYTILDPQTMLDAIQLGVDGMETDFPGVLEPHAIKGPKRPPMRREIWVRKGLMGIKKLKNRFLPLHLVPKWWIIHLSTCV